MRLRGDLAGLAAFVFLLLYPLAIVEARAPHTATLRRYKAGGIFLRGGGDLFTRERIVERKENRRWGGARWSCVENRRTWLCSSSKNEEGYWAQVRFPILDKKHKTIRKGWRSVCLVLSERPGLSRNRGPQRRLGSLA